MDIREHFNRFKDNCYKNGGVNIYPQFHCDLDSILTYMNLSLQYDEAEYERRAGIDFCNGGNNEE